MSGMKRREFLGALGLGTAGSLIASKTATVNAQTKNTQTKQWIEFAKGPSDKPLDVQLNIKPVFSPIIHTDVWEGPCRPSYKPKPMTEDEIKLDPASRWSLANGRNPQQERTNAKKGIQGFSNYLKENLSSDIQLLDPMMLEYSEDFWFSPEQMAKLEQERDKVDVYLFDGTLLSYPATVLAETFKKPVVMGAWFGSMDSVAYLKAKGLEGYAVFEGELSPLLSLLKTRKVFQQTRILIVTDREMPPLPVMSCLDVKLLKDKFGISSHFVSYREFSNEMDKVLKNKEWSGKAEDSAKQLIKNAAETHIDKQHVKRSFEFYYAVKNLMKKYGCNAFTVECFEFCASRVPDKYKITPCLVHTLLKDEGIASACEGDLNALLAMRLLMSVANKSSFMGNPRAFTKDQLVINHSVPGIKMTGYDKPDVQYHLRHFVESGWGTKVMIDFTKVREKAVTLARFNPLGTKIYIATGEVVDCSGFNKGTLIGCSLAAHVKVPDARECMRKMGDFGSHLTMVYGDYTKEIQGLADMMDLDVVYAT